LGTTCEFHSPDKDEVQRHIETAKRFIVLAHDVGATGVKVRPNGLPEGVPKEKTIRQIGEALKELGDFATGFGIEVWLEVHGRGTSDLGVIQAIMEVANHPQVGVCWNSNREDVVDGSVKANFERVRKWVRHAHINELWREDYPWRELFGLLRDANYEGWTMAEIPESADAVRLLRYYRALWRELTRP
jgi:sugar phosphate isomerase/epimerase